MAWQRAQQKLPTVYYVEGVVALSLSHHLQKLAKAPHIFSKRKDSASLHYYKFLSLHGHIKRNHYSSLLSRPPAQTLSHFPTPAIERQISVTKAAKVNPSLPAALDSPPATQITCACRRSCTRRCSCQKDNQSCHSYCHGRQHIDCGNKWEEEEGTDDDSENGEEDTSSEEEKRGGTTYQVTQR